MTRPQIAPETMHARLKAVASGGLFALLLAYLPSPLYAKDAAIPADETLPAAANKSTQATLASKNLAEKMREATENSNITQKRMVLVVNEKGGKSSLTPTPVPQKAVKTPSPATRNAPPVAEKIIDLDDTVRATTPVKRPPAAYGSRKISHAASVKAPSMAHPEKPQDKLETHAQTEGYWSYTGDTGPQAWSGLNKEFNSRATVRW